MIETTWIAVKTTAAPPKNRWRSNHHAGLGRGATARVETPRPQITAPAASAQATIPAARAEYHSTWTSRGAPCQLRTGEHGEPVGFVDGVVVVDDQSGGAVLGQQPEAVDRAGQERGLGQDLDLPALARDGRRRDDGRHRGAAGGRVDEVVAAVVLRAPGPAGPGAR